MPRKPSPKDEQVTVLVNGEPVQVTLYSPRRKQRTWYVYWKGLGSPRSTKAADFTEAVRVAESMLRNGGERPTAANAVMSDAEFEAIQRWHYGKKKDPAAAKRAVGSLRNCLEAISAFKAVSGLEQVTMATPDDCEKFQEKALLLPRNWRQRVSEKKRKKEKRTIRPNTVRKWSIALQAAFDRANVNAGKKCVRSVVSASKLLTSNPWLQFTWIEGTEPEIRQFQEGELISLIDYFESEYPAMPLAAAFVKVCLWSVGRRAEVSELTWERVKRIGEFEVHFHITGKWGVEKWARMPKRLTDELESLRIESPYVFAAYPEQLRAHHRSRGMEKNANNVSEEFLPANLGEWMYRQIKNWQKAFGRPSAYLHVFRKTSLQYARSGEEISRDVASDANVGERVMMTHYARIEDPQLRSQSNRTYQRILQALPLEVATRYGYEESQKERLMAKLIAAQSQEDWATARRIMDEIASLSD